MQHDLTQGSVSRRLVGMAAFIGLGLLFQTLYFLIDLYFVAGVGPSALAGVGLAGVVFFLVMAASQMVGVGSLSLIARAIGAKALDQVDAVYRQSLLMSVGLAALTLLAGYGFGGLAIGAVAADSETAQHGAAYLHGFLPALALMFPTGAMGAALRAAGVVRPTMLIQTGTVLLNAALAPVLIAGWGTGLPLGAFGAGLASSIAALVGFAGTVWLFGRVQTLMTRPLHLAAPDRAVLARIVGIGLPSAAEFLLMFLTTGIVYAVIRDFGPEAQAGFGVGSRVMQAVFLPAMAVSFAVAPVAGQNFGAGLPDRVRRTVRDAAIISCGLMLVLTLICQWEARWLVAPFTPDSAVAEVASTYLRIVSLNFVATGLIFIASGTFQALGDTRPALLVSMVRLVLFGATSLWLTQQPWVRLEHMWWASAGAALVHAAVALLFLRDQLRRKLAGLAPPEMTRDPAGA
ncbi:MAG: MATE family efflux transporter [Alphaproteobacteria bacterium]|jgi:putative MATE family efflux protein|nr:MATE family efflux transporter [Alphaproteobacteria bacterium]MBU2126013.1 MATE family efflux transporter [Alphaproteobacteria bacterium]MBU2209239.1 MATE family efflux transporter [Alphaproteobacteria bacterium]MBU2290399.1 MATE family efflux transporter [Alphaproteobacteria bacterium]MBU2396214.1 MATE family efflux transporter [Alphaproteobacteria bacterium]